MLAVQISVRRQTNRIVAEIDRVMKTSQVVTTDYVKRARDTEPHRSIGLPGTIEMFSYCL